MDRIGVLQLIDTLDMGGAERVATQLANHLPRDRYRVHLGTTRRDGPLADTVAPDVHRLHMKRSWTLDSQAIRQLVSYIRREQIDILHCHGTALLIGNIASRFARGTRVIWHDHYGVNSVRTRPTWLYRCLTNGVSGVFSVSEPLADWARNRLRLPADRVWYLPNFVDVDQGLSKNLELPGEPGYRIVCVANLRPVKDHGTLLRAFSRIVKEVPQAHLLLLGSESDAGHVARLRADLSELKLESSVSLLGPRQDVPDVLRQCDIGVLCSVCEGLPMSLLEYGAAALPVVVTEVGQCPAVVDQGRCGRLVPPSQPDRLAEEILGLLRNVDERRKLGADFREHVAASHSSLAAISCISRMYDLVVPGKELCHA